MIAFGTINVGTAIIAGGIGAILIWIIFAGAVASHGKDHGYSWGGLFLSALFLGWPLVLLAITINSGGQRPRNLPSAR
jgi:hypothetical protein